MDWCLIADINETLSWLWMIGSVAAGLGLVIFVHELGHFLAAKACGVKVEKFYVGFDIPMGPLPSTLLKFRRGETEYGIGILPLGGYVKMLGQDDNPRNQAKENERIKIHKGASASAESDDHQRGSAVTADKVDRAETEKGGDGGRDEAGDEVGDKAGEFEWDPRSYPAKPVWQRMIIISAGVIMNLVFAVIFAAIAYSQGVSYMPCLVGGTAPGDPAWVGGINPGDKILQIGRAGRPDEQLRFDKDLMIDVTLNGAKHPLDLLVRRAGGTELEWLSLTPTDRLADLDRPATLGVRNAGTTTVAGVQRESPEFSQDAGYGKLLPGDEIVAVDGVQLPRDSQAGCILEHQLERQLAGRMTKPVTLTVRRTGQTPATGTAAPSAAPAQTIEVTLPPTRLRITGLVMATGPVLGVRQGSPAEKAGFRAGDELVSMAGQEIGDAVTLSQRLLPLIGQEVEFGVRRGGATNPVLLRATPVAPDAFRDGFSYCAPVGVESLGLAFQLTNVVKEVIPGSPAAEKGLRAGDRIASVTFLKDGKELPDPVELIEAQSQWSRLWSGLTQLGGNSSNESLAEKALPNWYVIHTTLNMEPSLDLKLTYRRDGEAEKTVTLHPVASDEFFYPARRFVTMPLSGIRTAQSWSEAWALGYVETEVSVKKVLAVLHRLFTGRLSYRSLGGPIMIVRAAGSEASEGMARLLVFLTFLSANLAVLNFLPIPALDGGHMLFLAAEGIRGKPVNERLQVALTLIGVGCLLSLMVLVFGLDIQRFF